MTATPARKAPQSPDAPNTLGKILILGAGINGAAVARELALCGASVCVVDIGDIARGATAYSSRLIHGGLRYLEHREFHLVKESLQERARLLRLAPQFVRPLRLYIPVRDRFGGIFQAAMRFFGRARSWPWRGADHPTPRGLNVVRIGLWLYDRFASSEQFPRHQAHQLGQEGVPPFDPQRYRWACSYHDAQILYPERFVIALLRDAQRLASQHDASFDLFTYHEATLNGREVTIRPINAEESAIASSFEPAAVINATGAWVDRTLSRLSVASPRLMGGTKGSHLVTSNDRLRGILRENGVYAEASDSRPVFILPLADEVLIGTTDLPFENDPATATASEQEVEYLLDAVNQVFPQVNLQRKEVDLHYSGVRPLPHADEKTPAAVSRDHSLHLHPQTAVPLYSIVGGKITTCRALAEETAATVFQKLDASVPETSRDRVIPGAENYPSGETAIEDRWNALGKQFQLTREQVRRIWHLMGDPAAKGGLFAQGEWADDERKNLPGVDIPRGLVRYIIRHEWTTHLEDLVERRLMLLYDSRLSLPCLKELAEILAEEGKVAPEETIEIVENCQKRLLEHYGRMVE